MIIFFLVILTLFSREFFFTFYALLGTDFQGSESSSSYIYFNIGIVFLSFIIFFSSLIKNKFKVSKNFLVVFLIIFVIPIIYLIEYYLLNNVNVESRESILFFLVWGIPGILVGYIVGSNNNFFRRNSYKFKLFLIISALLSVNAISVFYSVLILGGRADLGGASYQTAGYNFLLALSFLFIYLSNNRFNKFSFIFIFWIILLIASTLLTGARGPSILSFLMSSLFFIKYKTNKVVVKYFILILFALFSYIVVSTLSSNEYFIKSLDRVFAFINDFSIDWSGTSGRQTIYFNTLELIREKPIFGYGLFSYKSLLGYLPHNLFLEILIQGGIIYLLIFTMFMIYAFKKIKMIESKFELSFILYLGFYQFGMLFFSGSYMYSTFFWFIISFTFLSHKYFDKGVFEYEKHSSN